ncbi:NADP-dependent malic enzyme [Candidatus Falkowbacteria bacterium]|uniref:NAD-dependent malic enzyme n=1 Tax=Candidatus Buchananbacteria bacterium CG10_big_fil_rev_8_21_14_0_10_33_19 TaxID=1974525 RepID=A0A2H0W3R1_9BACT|nr:NADP-dependent malic enzyme [Candidatus Falkowbacteria bacterium]PIS05986.1 MAG: NAD-dependent malic enzyme [Candidatus Buchananbacteria bacterium CG10_big_fil_rev_8_21_14_0_10_33_19]
MNQKALDLHEKNHGKIEIKSKVYLNTKDDLSLAYTPGVADVSRAIYEDKLLVKKYTNVGNSIAIITDGSAVLGLGNIGPEAAMPVMEGKAILFKEFGNIDAYPICLATQDTEEIIKTVKMIAPSFSGINLEDISAPRCFEIEQRLITELDIPVFHDDQHGTAIVVLAGLINALKITNKKIEDIYVVINGAGAAGMAITKLLMAAGLKKFTILDTQGTICKSRNDLNSSKQEMAEHTIDLCGDLTTAIVKADVFIGVSKGNILTADMIKSMNTDPIVFAMANPDPEIMPDLAKSAGVKIMATGRSDFPNQINNVLVFPGMFRGTLDNNIKKITTEMKLKAAQAIADYVTNPTEEEIVPSVLDKNVAISVAQAIK